MSELTEHRFESKDGIPLFLTVKRNLEGAPVLLLHGASARHETFTFPPPLLIPGREPIERSLMDWLHREGFEPWLLDWRGSGRVVDALQEAGELESHAGQLDFDAAAECDVPAAIQEIRKLRDKAPISAVGHCMGAGVLAQAIASGAVKEEHGLTRVVLLTLGLFYEPPLDGRLKSQDPVLEHLLAGSEPVPSVDPRVRALADWPRELAELYQNWPDALRPHSEKRHHPESLPEPDRRVNALEMCDRLSFMYGTPYFETNLAPGIHQRTWRVTLEGRSERSMGDLITGAKSGARGNVAEILRRPGQARTGALVLTGVQGDFVCGESLQVGSREIASCLSVEPAEAELPRQFGAIPLRMYVHGARNARRGWAARYDAADDDTDLLDDRALKRFGALERITLITGEKNQLWHRSSIDRMFEWLTRAFGGRTTARLAKHVLRGYGHQDLLWGREAPTDVFELIREGMRPRAPTPATHQQVRIAASSDSDVRQKIPA